MVEEERRWFLSEKIVIVENIRLVRLLALTADFGVKTTKAKLTPIFKLRERRAKLVYSKLSVYSINPDSNFDVHFLTYIL